MSSLSQLRGPPARCRGDGLISLPAGGTGSRERLTTQAKMRVIVRWESILLVMVR